MHAGDGLPDDADLGELGSGSASDLNTFTLYYITFTVPLQLYYLGHSELGELGLKIIELLGEVFLLLLAKLGALDLTHFVF